MNIIALAFDMTEAVEAFRQKAMLFFYKVMLLGHRCPTCNGTLVMVTDGRARCTGCGDVFDPTVTFQRCSSCGSVPKLQIRKYHCSNCGVDIQSRFLFDGLVFDPDYFRQKMVESRQRRQQRREKVRQMLAEARSNTLSLPPAELEAFPDLIDALNQLTEGPQASMEVESQTQFDLHRYESHIQAHVQDFPRCLTEIPPLTEDLRKDLVWRFIAIIFLAHTGQIDIRQNGSDIMVTKHETNRKRQNLPADLEDADGIQGPVCGVEAG